VAVSAPPLTETAYVARRPELLFLRLKSMQFASGGSATVTTPALTLLLDEDESDELRTFTETNVGSRVLILLGTNSIAAPVIRAPVKNGALTIEFPDKRLYATAIQLLAPDPPARTSGKD
jgi:hypothetical protein